MELLNQTHLENRRSDPPLPRPNFAQTSPPTPSPSTSSLPMRARTIVFERGGSEPRYKWLSSPLARRRIYLPAWARKMSRERGAGGVRSAARNLRFSKWFGLESDRARLPTPIDSRVSYRTRPLSQIDSRESNRAHRATQIDSLWSDCACASTQTDSRELTLGGPSTQIDSGRFDWGAWSSFRPGLHVGSLRSKSEPLVWCPTWDRGPKGRASS